MRRSLVLLLISFCSVLGQLGCGVSIPCNDAKECVDDPSLPQLAAIRSNLGVLKPAFDPNVKDYQLELSVRETDAEIVVEAPSADVLVVDGVEAGEREATIQTARVDGRSHEILVSANGEDTRYTIRVVSSEATNVATGKDGEYFGSSIGLDADRMIVGAPLDSTRSRFGGTAYIYRFINGTWELEAQLFQHDPGEQDYFGHAVAISGDTVVIGAYRKDDVSTNANNAGAAYVFVHDGTGWQQEAKLLARDDADGRDEDRFGVSVAIDGDVAVVGAYVDEAPNDELDKDYGAVHVFRRSKDGWQQEARLFPRFRSGRTQFGGDVSIDANTIVVGAKQDHSAADFAGAAYVYEFDGQEWRESGYLTRDVPSKDDYFGGSVSVDGQRIVVGAIYGGEHKNAGPWHRSNGAAFVFEKSNGQWKQQSQLQAPDVVWPDFFGANVGIHGDVAVISAPREQGVVYLFRYDDEVWQPIATLTSPMPVDDEGFGGEVAISMHHIAVGRQVRDRGSITVY